MSDICHIYETEDRARYELRRFAYENPHRIKNIFRDDRNRIITDDGNTHWYMSERRYYTWCKGRTYFLDGHLMHSGYAIAVKGESK